MGDPVSAWKETRHTESRCPCCDHKLDAASSPDVATPKPGDFSVCISCASLLVFVGGLKFRAMTVGEFDELDVQTKNKLRLFQRAVRGVDRRELRNG